MKCRVMSSLLGRLPATRVFIGLLTALSITTACASKSPTEPSSGGTTPSPNVSIVSMSVAAETLVSGAHVYRVTVKLRESGGAAATIASIDLTFMSGSSAVTSLHVERPISDAANLLAANATLDSRELMAMDEDPSHPHATSVVAKVNYTYGASLTRSADGSAPVPLSSAPNIHVVGHRHRREHCGAAGRGWDRPGRRRAERGKERHQPTATATTPWRIWPAAVSPSARAQAATTRPSGR